MLLCQIMSCVCVLPASHWVSLLRRLRGRGSLRLLAAAAGSLQRVEMSGALQQVREVGYTSQQQPGAAEASGQHGGQSLEHVRIQVSPNLINFNGVPAPT